MSIEVGDHCPDVSGIDQSGNTVRLADVWRNNVLVLFFYPKDGTSVCTQEACSFRDTHEEFLGSGAEVLGVSGDSAARHQRFIAEHRLPYRLLSDSRSALRKAFGVPRFMGFMPGRATYVIDKTGIVRHIVNGHLVSEPHIKEALSVVKRFQTDGDKS